MAAAAERVFQESTGARGLTQILLGINAPSGAGKTKSALRIATGIQRVSGGDIWVIDTENNRARHYDDQFRFRHLPFDAPYGPSDYRAAFEHCRRSGAKVIIADSGSHLHEGRGGILQWHAQEVERIMAAWRCSEEKANIPAWHKPKAALREFIDYFTHIDCHVIFTFKARDKIKLGGGKVATLGFMPIASDELVFELTANCLLLPGAGGVPTLQSNEVGERLIIKLPDYLQKIFSGAAGKPLDESIGQGLAEWAGGSKRSSEPTPPAPAIADYEACTTRDAFDALEKRRADVWKSMTAAQKSALKAASDAAGKRLAQPAERTPFAKDSAIEALKACTTEQQRADVMAAIVDDFDARNEELPLDVDDCNNVMREKLASGQLF